MAKHGSVTKDQTDGFSGERFSSVDVSGFEIVHCELQTHGFLVAGFPYIGDAYINAGCHTVNGCETVHGELQTHSFSGEGFPYIDGSAGFSVQEVHEKSIQVSYTSEQDERCCSRKFVAPVTTFTTIHSPRKMIYSLDVTPGGLAVSSDSEGKLKIWESSTGTVRRELEGHYGDVYTCRFFPSGIVVLSGGSDMQLKIWSAETGQCAATLLGHTAGIQDTSIVERGRNIVSCSRDGTAKLWDCGTKQCLGTFSECGGSVNSCAVGAVSGAMELGQPESIRSDKEVLTEGKLLLLGCENKMLQGYGLHSRKKIFDLDCHDAVNCCSFLSDVCVACGTQDGHITVTDLRNIRVPLKEWKDSRSTILSLLPWKQGVFASTGDGSCFYINSSLETTTELTGSDCDPLYRTVTDGKFLYTACRDSAIRKYLLSQAGL